MRKLIWIVPLAFFFLNPAIACGPAEPQFQYGAVEMRAAVEGDWSFTITPDGGTYRYEGVISDIVPDQRIVYSYEMYAGQDLGSVSLATVEIAAEGSGTKLTYTEQGAFLDGIEKPEDRQKLGWMFDNLGTYLASPAG